MIVAVGVVAMLLSTAGLFALRTLLTEYGYDVPPVVFILTFLVVVGAAYGLAAKLVLREVKKPMASNGAPKGT